MIVALDECTSTQDEVRAQLRSRAVGPRALVAVRADRQIEGRGREGRGWQTPPQQGLLTSLGWRGPLPVSVLEDLPRVVAHAVRDVLAEHASIDPAQIGWSAPNDLIDPRSGRKLAGVLVDTVITGDQVHELCVGIGANLAGAAFALDDGREVTTLAAIAGRDVDVSVDALAQLVLQLAGRISARWSADSA